MYYCSNITSKTSKISFYIHKQSHQTKSSKQHSILNTFNFPFFLVIIIIFDMEGDKLPSLQKSTSVEANIPEKENGITISLPHKYKVGSFPQLPQEGTPTFNRGLLITKKLSCSQRYQEQVDGIDPNILYVRVLSLIKEMISNPSKFQLLLSALHSMEGSVRNGRKMKGSLDFNSSRRRNIKNKLSERSIEVAKETTQKLANSLGLSQQGEDVGEKSKHSYQICDFMAESIEIQYPFESIPGTNEKGSLDQSEDLKISHLSAAKSIQEEMLDSLHLPSFTDMYKKISLLLVDDSQGNGSDLCSSASSNPPTFPNIPFNLDLVIAVFGDASPLLMNLALSLLFKFMLRSKTKLTLQNAGMLLSLSALLGYKIFYDQTLQGILEYFSGVLNVQNDETVRLERWFLAELNYEVLINNKHYTEIMMKLMSNQ